MVIHDGYTRPFTLACGIVGEVRPMLRHERQWLRGMAAVYPDPEMHDLIRKVIAGRIVHWSLGQPFEVLRFQKTYNHEAWDELVENATGIKHAAEEDADASNLFYGVQIKARFPHLSPATCDHCLKFFYDPIDNETEYDDATGRQYPRPEEALPLCRVGNCPNGSPEQPLSLSAKNRKALAFHFECRAVNHWPDDVIVRRNARLIESALAKVRASRKANARNRT